MVVESGPVVYDDAAAEDEEEEDEEACVSAMDLLGGNGQSQLPVSRFRTPPFPPCDRVFGVWIQNQVLFLMILPRVTALAAAATL